MVLKPIMWLASRHELFNLFISGVDEVCTVLMVLRELIECTKIVRVDHWIWFESEFKIFHARFNLFFISVDVRFWIFIFLNFRNSLTSLRIKYCEIIMRLLAFVLKYIGYPCGRNKASTLSDLWLWGSLSLKQGHSGCKLEGCLITPHW